MKSLNLKSITLCLVSILFLSLLSCNSDDDNNQVQPISTELEGDYVGTWNSVTPTTSFTDYAFSASLEIVDTNILTGSWYAIDSFEGCCSEGDDDGTITMSITGNTITSFLLEDIITDCSGTFTGDGFIRESDNALVVNFTGTDCDGLHEGQMIFEKQ
ncbi:hypothetical protein [Psychroserpens sp. Hel_I_66]|uniref:hypothetical protein n=1 Tax=Psychroserpens sp. Hel_I_66 TaxID=1250004 RepID=UPI000647ABCC|nr:hypothetical protein [Psychroserpens sp. Hel_I_66]